MNYKDAVIQVMNSQKETEIKNPFLLRSFLSDYIGSDYTGAVLLSTFRTISNEVDFISIIKNKGLNLARKELTVIYRQKFEHIIKPKEYVDSINPFFEALFPKEYEEYQNSKKQATKQNPSNPVAVIKKAPAPVANITPPLVLNKQVPPKKPKPIQNNVTNTSNTHPLTGVTVLQLTVSCARLTIDRNLKRKALTLYDRNTGTIIPFTTIQTANTMQGNINANGKDVVLVLPEKSLKDLRVRANKSNVLYYDYSTKMPKRVDIHTTKGSIFLFQERWNSSKPQVNTFNLKTDGGDISFDLAPNVNSSYFINAKTKNGNIRGKADNYLIRPNIDVHHFFGKYYNYNVSLYEKATNALAYAVLNVSTGRGRINIQ